MQTQLPRDIDTATRIDVVADDGVRLAAVVQGEGPGLLLVHGLGGAKEDFSDHVGAFAKTHTVVTYDIRGHGESDDPLLESSYSFARVHADTLAVADAVGLDTFVLLGHSMGGMAVRRIAIEQRQRVTALIMMDTCAGPIPALDPEILELGASIAFDEGKEALKAALDMAAPLDTEAYQRTLKERPGFEEFCDAKWASLSAVMWGALARAIARQADDLSALCATGIPTLVIVGEQDAAFRKAADEMAATMPGAQLAVIPGAGHSPQFENGPAWRFAMDQFLAHLTERQSA